jgi:hypothetical protein
VIDWKRTLLALSVAPLGLLVGSFVLLIVGGLVSGKTLQTFAFWPISSLGLLVAYPATLVVGLPVHLLLSKFNVDWKMYAFAGVLSAALLGEIVFRSWSKMFSHTTSSTVFDLVFMLTAGAVIGGAFGRIALPAKSSL